VISKARWILFLMLMYGQAIWPQTQTPTFVVQHLDTNGGSNVLLVGAFAEDGGQDIVTTDANNNLLCYPNPGTRGNITVPPIVNSTQFGGAPLPQITAWASANLLTAAHNANFGANVLLGIDGSLISYGTQPPEASPSCTIARVEWMGPFGAGSPNIILSGYGLVSGSGPDVLVGSSDGSFSVIYNDNVGSTGILGTDGPQNLGLEVQGAVIGNVGSPSFPGAWQLEDGTLVFISPTLPPPLEPTLSGTLTAIVNTPNGATFLASISGSTLYLSPLTWDQLTPSIGSPITFTFPAAISSLAVGSFGNGFGDDVAVATADGKITIVSDSTGQGSFSLGQSLTVEVGTSMTIVEAVLDSSGQYKGMQDLAIQTNTGNLYIAWQTIPVAAPVITVQPASLTVVTGQPATFSVTATGSQLSYQWTQNSNPIAGATAASYTIAATTASQNDSSYQVVVSNPSGSITSQTATLTVSPDAPITYTLTVNTSGSPGSVTQNPTGTTFASGTPVTLTAVPGAASVFSGWSGGCSGTQLTCIVTMDQNQTVLATFGPAPGFTIALNPASATVPAGSGATAAITVTPTGGFSGTVTYSCSGAPSKATCSINGATLNITTTAATTSSGFGGPGLVGALIGCLALLTLPRRNLRRALSVATLLFVVLAGMSACQSLGTASTKSISIPGTPVGTYTLTITGTSGSTASAASFVLNVQ